MLDKTRFYDVEIMNVLKLHFNDFFITDAMIESLLKHHRRRKDCWMNIAKHFTTYKIINHFVFVGLEDGSYLASRDEIFSHVIPCLRALLDERRLNDTVNVVLGSWVIIVLRGKNAFELIVGDKTFVGHGRFYFHLRAMKVVLIHTSRHEVSCLFNFILCDKNKKCVAFRSDQLISMSALLI